MLPLAATEVVMHHKWSLSHGRKASDMLSSHIVSTQTGFCVSNVEAKPQNEQPGFKRPNRPEKQCVTTKTWVLSFYCKCSLFITQRMENNCDVVTLAQHKKH